MKTHPAFKIPSTANVDTVTLLVYRICTFAKWLRFLFIKVGKGWRRIREKGIEIHNICTVGFISKQGYVAML